MDVCRVGVAALAGEVRDSAAVFSLQWYIIVHPAHFFKWLNGWVEAEWLNELKRDLVLIKSLEPFSH